MLPFLDLLGIDLQYRGGTSFGKDDEFDGKKNNQIDSIISNKVERHQWVQAT